MYIYSPDGTKQYNPTPDPKPDPKPDPMPGTDQRQSYLFMVVILAVAVLVLAVIGVGLLYRNRMMEKKLKGERRSVPRAKMRDMATQ